jgi:hypothetical protein
MPVLVLPAEAGGKHPDDSRENHAILREMA